jgi:hypothetical protein
MLLDCFGSWIVIPVVVGSRPISHPSIIKHLELISLGAFLFCGALAGECGGRVKVFWISADIHCTRVSIVKEYI